MRSGKPRNRHSEAIKVAGSLEDWMRRSILAGACLLLAASMASAQPVPTPAPRPKTSIAPPAAAVTVVTLSLSAVGGSALLGRLRRGRRCGG